MPTTAPRTDDFTLVIARFCDTATAEQLLEFAEAPSLVMRVVALRDVVSLETATLRALRDAAEFLRGTTLMRAGTQYWL